MKTGIVTEVVIKCCAWFQVRDKTGIKDLITIMIKDMGTTIVLTVIKATAATEDTTTLGTTIPITDMDRDTQITVANKARTERRPVVAAITKTTTSHTKAVPCP